MAQHRTTLLFILGAILFLSLGFWESRAHRTPMAVEDSSPWMIEGGPDRDGIPAIHEPRFESLAEADVYLEDDGLGLVVTERGEARFYPYQILVWHEAVNDVFRGREILVSYAPLTFSGAVYDRTLGDQVLTFGVSGKLMDNNTILYDIQTESLWSQLKGEGVEGPLTGERLGRLPAEVLSWASFKRVYPNGEILSRQTGADRDYTQNPYGREGYWDSAAVWFPLSHEDERLPAKTIIHGYEEDGIAVAYPAEYVQEADDERILRSAYWFAWASAYPNTLLY
ncbi:DUF3179 domain-containing protein [Candidatus Uhrbacteria bacterium]|nr:DUF3179 domain-containing protein [Candidatus Uhrbacteria bacterium]